LQRSGNYPNAVSLIYVRAYENIQQLYLPVQPTVRQPADDVTYRELLPHKALQPYISCYWQLRTEKILEAQFNYRVVADGCIDIFFECNNPAESYVMGFCKQYTEFPLEFSFHYIGIRFLPTMFPQLFKINAAELSNRFLPLDDIAPAMAAFIAGGIDCTYGIESIAALFDGFFLESLRHTRLDEDIRLYDAITAILRNNGVIDIETQLDTGISPRQLRRLFEYYVGDTAKTFAKVVRFQHLLRAKPSVQSLRKNKLFFDAGYYDQAHFIKEFRNFYGTTPAKAFDR